MNFFIRKANFLLKRELKKNKAVLILGARQVGKTTLVEKILGVKDNVFLNLDIEIDKAKFLSMAKLPVTEILKMLKNKTLIIDEAQRLEETGRIIKGWFDSKLEVKFVLLGSSSLDILNRAAEPLTGRNVKLYLPPLLFNEVLENQDWYENNLNENVFGEQIQKLLLSNVVFGNYPEAVGLAEDEKEKYLLNLTTDYLLRDVFYLGLVKSPDLINKMLMLLAFQVGSEASVLEISSNLGIARQTVERYLELLERSFVIFRLPAFGGNLRKEIVKNQKIYFYDTGVRNAILKEFGLSVYRGDIGKLWENFVVAEITKMNMLGGNRYNVYFWRNVGGGEVDLIISRGSRVVRAVEIKWNSEKIGKNKVFEDKYGTKVKNVNRNNVTRFLAEMEKMLLG